MIQDDIIRRLVEEEVMRRVGDAFAAGRILSAYDCAAQIMLAYPNCRIEQPDLVNVVIAEAAAAGVAVEIAPLRDPARQAGFS